MSEEYNTHDFDDTEVGAPDETSEERYQRLTSDDREAITLMGSLLNNAGWHALSKLMKAEIQLRRNKYELDTESTYDSLISREYLRGEIAQLRVILALPEQLKENAEAGLSMRNNEAATRKEEY